MVSFNSLLTRAVIIIFNSYVLAADQTQSMQDQMSLNAAGQMPQDPKQAFKNEWEALEITEYKNALQTACEDLLASTPEEVNNIHH